MNLMHLLKTLPLNMPIKIGTYHRGQFFDGSVYLFLIDDSLKKWFDDEYEVWRIDADYNKEMEQIGLNIILMG